MGPRGEGKRQKAEAKRGGSGTRGVPRALFLLPVAFSTGCFLIERWDDAAVEAEGKRIAVLPFRDPAGGAAKGIGAEIVGDIPARIQRKAPGIRVVDARELERVLRGTDPARTPLAEIGRRVSADYVLSGEVALVMLNEPGFIGVKNGRIEVLAEIVAVATDTYAMPKKKLVANYPREGEHRQASVLAEDAEVRRDLAGQMGKQLAELFYRHKVYGEDDFRPPWAAED